MVLLVGLALGVEWGYGLTQRRVMQNAADGGALAGAKLLASTVSATTGGGTRFRVSQQDVYCAAVEVADANRSFRPANEPETLVISGSADKVTWTTFAQPNVCPAPAGGTTVDAATRYVRAQAQLTYRGLFGAATGTTSVTAGATAVARITGAPVSTGGYTWPTMRHFNPADFQCTPPCTDPVTFWSSQGSQKDIVFGNFKGLIDFSRYSPNINRSGPSADQDACTDTPDAGCVPQLMETWDQSSIAAPFKTNIAGDGTCSPPAPAGKWFSGGNEKDQNYESGCSVPNWAAYSFSGGAGFGTGKIGLNTNWYAPKSSGGDRVALQEAPDDAFKTESGRSSCDALRTNAALAVLPAPSCPNTPANAVHGDWIETSPKGDLGSNAANAMKAFINAHPLYDDRQHQPTGPGNAPEYGPHQVIDVFLWDCAESFDGSQPAGHQWSLAMPKVGEDCSNIHDNTDTADTIDRVHVLTVAPFTFYLGLIDSSKIRGFWGGAVQTDPGICRTDPGNPVCVLNPFSNAVFLVSEN